ncbi:O-antigen ligase [Agitococcus lubricus]|uniref:O-antigen ligase n=2 Tax=Agitococcus lubricus TaxID=1077255 RepID=A0A2T5J047_9GAMM|nr:O-antigen ligase [Agitococcus lubricus]
MHSFLFIFLCIIVFWSPLPLGSNRDWSMSLLALLTSLLVVSCLLTFQRNHVAPRALKQHKGLVLLFFMIPLWIVIQIIPLPSSFIAYISPQSMVLSSSQDAWLTISTNREASLNSLQKSLCYALFFSASLVIINTPKRLETVCQVLVMSGVFQACYGVMVVLGGSSFDVLHIMSPYLGSTTGTFINRNHLAGYLEMIIPIGIGLLITHILQNKNQWAGLRSAIREFISSLLSGKARIRIFLAIMVVALVLSHSRMGNTAFFASLGLCGVFGIFIYRKHHKAKSLFVLFSSLIIIDIFILGAWFGLDKLAQRLEKTSSDEEQRVYVFQQTLQAIQDYWLTGSGAGSYYSIFPLYRNADISNFYDHAHNDFLQIGLEYGLIGSLIFAAIVIYSLTCAVQAQVSRHTAILKGVGFGVMMAILSIMIHSTTDFNLQIPANALLFSLLCALACIAHGIEHQEHPKRKSSKSRTA